MTAMQNNKEAALQLEKLIHKTIPLGKAMDLHVIELTDNFISLQAPVAHNNINIHGTAFAGSIYSMCVLTGWGFMHMRLLKESIKADVVVAQAEIRYLKPINEKIFCRCEVKEEDYAEFSQRLLDAGKASIAVVVHALEDENEKAILEARIVVKTT
jgi:thioesterase domain-containing protein